jgi:succinate dehydrogenase/fumarate reductase cytochrome b subunit
VLDAGLLGIVAFHAVNGLRLILFDFSIGLRYQKALFWAAFVVAVGMFIGSLVAVRNLF